MAVTASRPTTSPRRGLFESKRGRVIVENLTAYIFLSPALLIIFLFGIFPVGFAFFVSLHRWRRFPDEYRGLDQYIDALGSFAFVVFFWLSIGALVFALWTYFRTWQQTRDDRRGLLFVVPGAINAAAILLIINWFFILLPVILTVPVRLRGQQIDQGLFIQELFNSFVFPEPLAAANVMWLAVIASVLFSVLFLRFFAVRDSGKVLTRFTLGALMVVTGVLLMQLTLAEIGIAVEEAREAGESLPVWSQIILISAGVALLLAAWALWVRIGKADTNRRFILMGLAVVALVIGGVLLILELPPALADADRDVMNGFSVTIMYSLGTVPLQLVIGLGLAVLLFQNIKAKSFYRVVYFLPYITPFVATSLIFTLLFSHRSGSPANQLLNTFGIAPQTWLLEPRGINQLLFGPEVPAWLAGPGLALIVIIIYTTWTYAGYSTVIFLAGLGNIPRELYEAAKIDGANGWQQFRNITLPLLSPTTFFLILIATIGTFQAFTQIWLMRKPGALTAVDTINIYIFEEINASNPDYAYGSAMAFVLFAVILMLTIFQNRIIGRRVFYG